MNIELQAHDGSDTMDAYAKLLEKYNIPGAYLRDIVDLKAELARDNEIQAILQKLSKQDRKFVQKIIQALAGTFRITGKDRFSTTPKRFVELLAIKKRIQQGGGSATILVCPNLGRAKVATRRAGRPLGQPSHNGIGSIFYGPYIDNSALIALTSIATGDGDYISFQDTEITKRTIADLDKPENEKLVQRDAKTSLAASKSLKANGFEVLYEPVDISEIIALIELAGLTITEIKFTENTVYPNEFVFTVVAN